MNIQNLMAQANKMQQELEKTQKEIDVMEFTAKSQIVEVIMNGKREVKKINILNNFFNNQEDIEMLEDMIVLAFNEVLSQVDKTIEEKMGKHTKALKGLF